MSILLTGWFVILFGQAPNFLYLGLDFLLADSYNMVTGKSPFVTAGDKEESFETAQKQAFEPISISARVLAKISIILNEILCPLYCVLALSFSGLTLDQIYNLTWGSIEFIDGFDDFAVVHLYKAKVLTAKHDYSRPLIPFVARYLHRVYLWLCETFDKSIVDGWLIAGEFSSANTPLDREEIKTGANNVLVRAGYSAPLTKPGRQGNTLPISIRILRKNYQHSLIRSAGLANDPDTFHFLCGLQFKSSTYNNYESHTDPDAQLRLYTILKSLDPQETITTQSKQTKTKGNTKTITVTPATTHQAAQISGKVPLKAGQEISIRCQHGVTGTIFVS